MEEWQPIETAPRDRRVLVFCSDTREPFVAQQMQPMMSNERDWIFCRVINEDNEQLAVKCHPDLWQELPPAPVINDNDMERIGC